MAVPIPGTEAWSLVTIREGSVWHSEWIGDDLDAFGQLDPSPHFVSEDVVDTYVREGRGDADDLEPDVVVEEVFGST